MTTLVSKCNDPFVNLAFEDWYGCRDGLTSHAAQAHEQPVHAGPYYVAVAQSPLRGRWATPEPMA